MVSATPKIKDVAAKAGVSPTTVSHVFSGRRPVAPDTQRRVLAAAQSLGYRPDASARRLASGRSTTIALEIELAGGGILLNPYFSSVMSALSVAALQRGFTFALLPGDPKDGLEVRSELRSRGAAGAIVIDPTRSNRWVPRLIEDGIRVVTIGRYPGDLSTSWVDNDHRQGMADLVAHLASTGRKRPALLSVHEQTSLIIDLERAFHDATAAHGLTGRIIYLPDLTEASGQDISRSLLTSSAPPDSIIGAIDRVAVGVIRAAREIGLDVPSDLAVAGVGNTILASRCRPPLTSIQSSPAELAHEAVNLIADAWHNPELPQRQILLPAELTIRLSSANHLRDD